MEDLFLRAVINEITWQQVALTIVLVWLTQFGTWLVKQVWNWFRHRSKPSLHDFQVYQKYLDIFSQDVVDFLRIHNFANPYVRDTLDRIYEAYTYARFSSPEFTFHDKNLEKVRNGLKDALDSFSGKLIQETFVLNNNIRLANVPYRENDPEQNKRYQIIDELNGLANNLIKKFDTFNAACLRKFDQKIITSDKSPAQS